MTFFSNITPKTRTNNNERREDVNQRHYPITNNRKLHTPVNSEKAVETAFPVFSQIQENVQPNAQQTFSSKVTSKAINNKQSEEDLDKFDNCSSEKNLIASQPNMREEEKLALNTLFQMRLENENLVATQENEHLENKQAEIKDLHNHVFSNSGNVFAYPFLGAAALIPANPQELHDLSKEAFTLLKNRQLNEAEGVYLRILALPRQLQKSKRELFGSFFIGHRKIQKGNA